MNIDTVNWDEFQRRFRWRQSEHVTIIAPTGGGKTTLEVALIPKRQYSIFFATKRTDPLYRELLAKHGFVRVERFGDILPVHKRILLWPHHKDTIRQTYSHQAAVFTDALNHIVKQGAWTVWFDECKYMVQMLGMGPEVTFANEQLRSADGTIVNVAQRPVWIGKSALSNASHVFLWKTTDAEDTRTLANVGGINAKEIVKLSQSLGKHEFLYIHTRGTESRLLRSQVRR